MYEKKDIIWGYNFTMGKRKVKAFLQPTKGVLSSEQWSVKNGPKDYKSYFIPLKPDGEPDCLLAVPLVNVCTASTEEEASEKYDAIVRDGFNRLMDNARNYLNYFTPGWADDNGLRDKLEDLKFDD